MAAKKYAIQLGIVEDINLFLSRFATSTHSNVNTKVSHRNCSAIINHVD